MQDVFIIGSRGLPAQYGGFETFVEELVTRQQDKSIRYHVACLSDDKNKQHVDYRGTDCFMVPVPKFLGPARVIAYDLKAIAYALDMIKEQGLKHPIFYVLGNTIGGLIGPVAHQIKKVGGKLYVNPDGLEWKRSKWSRPVQYYLKQAEKQMSKSADLLICDNPGIEDYMTTSYPWAKTTVIAYGTDVVKSSLTADHKQVRAFFEQWQSREKGYYLIVGRFVPENNYAAMIRAFMASQTQRDLLIICNHEGNSYWETLRKETQFDRDRRIKFVGTVYDKALLSYVRQSAFAYLHGHEVGGTNPGLLEALAQTDLNLVLGVDFNRQVAKDTALYWDKGNQSLTQLIDHYDQESDFSAWGKKARQRMLAAYSWEQIVGQYEELFLDEG
ncbi:beta 1-4 rhamnosyltransferase Cps2T [Streptococcus cuniculipharyngis]|uniref:Glycosyltransferase family 1 protein n=1 Tax=Streptococcus cuniculipharyngis TaxID=1562651 RepID=A0A5C5SF77_9STRE|nr:glycosyltransferase family 1 protein [Streptococcus cuniculipharyngis]TWS98962.1 glycosyltransferase family 1 protein [Streptococcus cuniculipharyngis]